MSQTAFDASSLHAFIGSPRYARNEPETPLGQTGTLGIYGNGTVYENVRERAIHDFLSPPHIHTQLVSGNVILGPRNAPFVIPTVNGSGWHRCKVRIKGVCGLVPRSLDLDIVETERHTQRVAALFYLFALPVTGHTIHSVFRPRFLERRLPDAAAFGPRFDLLQTTVDNGIGLNYSTGSDFSDAAVIIDRLLEFSAVLPLSCRLATSGGWTGFPNGLPTFYTGGTAEPSVDYTFATFAGLRGTAIGNGGQDCCRNDDALNTMDLNTPPALIMASPLHQVRLQVKFISAVADPASPRAETWQDL